MIIKNKNNIIVNAFLLNILVLCLMLLIYVPFFSPDDYMMATTYYGGYTGEYDYHGIYENFIFGKIIVFFSISFPGIAVLYIDVVCFGVFFFFFDDI